MEVIPVAQKTTYAKKEKEIVILMLSVLESLHVDIIIVLEIYLILMMTVVVTVSSFDELIYLELLTHIIGNYV